MKEEFKLLNRFIKLKGLRATSQREKILGCFLSTEKHVSADELHKIVKKRYNNIGYTTVYRTVKLLSEAGLCTQVDFGDGVARFEHKYGHQHHDHLICEKCGKLIEIISPEIEKIQNAMAKEHGFVPKDHKLDIFGICKECSI